jgi:hypothetical protein
MPLTLRLSFEHCTYESLYTYYVVAKWTRDSKVLYLQQVSRTKNSVLFEVKWSWLMTVGSKQLPLHVIIFVDSNDAVCKSLYFTSDILWLIGTNGSAVVATDRRNVTVAGTLSGSKTKYRACLHQVLLMHSVRRNKANALGTGYSSYQSTGQCKATEPIFFKTKNQGI